MDPPTMELRDEVEEEEGDNKGDGGVKSRSLGSRVTKSEKVSVFILREPSEMESLKQGEEVQEGAHSVSAVWAMMVKI